MRDYIIELDPASNKILHIKLLMNVENMKALRKKLLEGKLKCCLIKPTLIYEPFQIAVAANKAVTSTNLTTKTIHTEILFNLSISKNISQSLKKFGIDDNDMNVIVATVYPKGEEDPMCEILKDIEGRETDISELSELTDLNAIRKFYKISDSEAQEIPLVTSIISRIATKDFISH